MKNLYNIYSSNQTDKLMIEATIQAQTELEAQKIYYRTCLITKRCFNFQYFAEKVIFGGPFLVYDKKIKQIICSYFI